MESFAIVFVWTIQNKFVTSLAWHALSAFPLRSPKNQSFTVSIIYKVVKVQKQYPLCSVHLRMNLRPCT